MAASPPSEPNADHLKRGAMGTVDIVFFVLAGVAPMGVVVALLSLSVALGNGAGVPGTYLIAGIVLALFATGYVQMSRRTTNVGGFYTYAREGLGKQVGGAAAYLALVAYNAGTIGIFGSLAYFAQAVVLSLFDVDIAWQWWAVIAFVIVAALSYFQVTLSAKVLALALACEVAVLLVFDIAVLVKNGFHGFSLDVFKPSVVFAGGFGISLMLAFGSFAGFEATALLLSRCAATVGGTDGRKGVVPVTAFLGPATCRTPSAAISTPLPARQRPWPLATRTDRIFAPAQRPPVRDGDGERVLHHERLRRGGRGAACAG